jgi:hypothetical protein
MKALFYLNSAIVLLFTIGSPNAISQDNVPAGRAPVVLQRPSPRGNLIRFVAATIVQRSDDELRKPTSFGDTLPLLGPRVLHLAGNVEITIFSTTLMPHPTRDDLFVKDMIITADEADYDPLSGEIKPQGHVAVKLQNAAK